MFENFDDMTETMKDIGTLMKRFEGKTIADAMVSLTAATFLHIEGAFENIDHPEMINKFYDYIVPEVIRILKLNIEKYSDSKK